MIKYYYKKPSLISLRNGTRFFSLFLLLGGVLILSYVLLPFISWQVYFAPVFASSDMQAPIPKTTIVGSDTLGSLLSGAASGFGKDYANAENWFPTAKLKNGQAKVPSYTLSIPALGVNNAFVSTTDYDLDKHLVHYGNTPVPSDKGNAIIFGHSTLPQLFNKNDYKTIFANVYTLKLGDEIIAEVNGVSYKYKIFSQVVVNPTDTSVFSQKYDSSYITLVTCTPPGTTWKRLITKAQMEKI